MACSSIGNGTIMAKQSCTMFFLAFGMVADEYVDVRRQKNTTHI